MADIREMTQRLLKNNYTTTKNAISEQLVFGTVTGIKDKDNNPKIKIKVDNKYEVEEGASLIISSLCKDPLLANGLQKGDKVRMLSLNNNKILYCIEKEV